MIKAVAVLAAINFGLIACTSTPRQEDAKSISEPVQVKPGSDPMHPVVPESLNFEGWVHAREQLPPHASDRITPAGDQATDIVLTLREQDPRAPLLAADFMKSVESKLVKTGFVIVKRETVVTTSGRSASIIKACWQAKGYCMALAVSDLEHSLASIALSADSQSAYEKALPAFMANVSAFDYGKTFSPLNLMKLMTFHCARDGRGESCASARSAFERWRKQAH